MKKAIIFAQGFLGESFNFLNNSSGKAVVLQLTPARSGSHVECDVSPVEH
jgi:hypothetical protein